MSEKKSNEGEGPVNWEPQLTSCSVRSQGRPKTRWEDNIKGFLLLQGLDTNWLDYSGNWAYLEPGFVEQ